MTSTSYQTVTSSFAGRNEEACCSLVTAGNSSSSGGRKLRNAKISSSGDTVTFQDGVTQNNGESTYVDNTIFIPIRIIGFKFTRN